MAPSLSARQYWIFDMDGTLTVAVHDFAAMRAALDIPPGSGLLEYIDSLPATEAGDKHLLLRQIELEYARAARAQPGAPELLQGLRARGARVGILTRNTCENARVTLEACGLLDFFAPRHIIGRECAAPKPSPAGIEVLLESWNAAPRQAVMCGDFRFDLEAGRQAGTATVYVDIEGADAWTALADFRVCDLHQLRRLAGL